MLHDSVHKGSSSGIYILASYLRFLGAFAKLRMRNVLDERCTENQNTRFVVSNFFPKIAPFIISKIVVEREGPEVTSQYGAYALHGG